MYKKRIIASAAVVLTITGIFTYVKMTAPPAEEWISYENEEVIKIIDEQLQGIDMERLVKEKETYITEKSISEIQQQVRDGAITYEEITAIYLYRIKKLDQKEKGYNSVVTINPGAMAEAREKDSNRKKEGETVQSLYGIPVMLKDNINTKDMPVSSGVAAFSGFYAKEDAALVRTLKERGAILLGKNNMSEFAYYVSGIMPSGYSGSKGQTINPFGPLKLSASGSSSGSAVAVTANLTPVSIGTETDGSIVAPASANSVVGFKPSREEILSDGIMPLVREIDTAGPIAKNVADAAIAYKEITGADISLDFDKDALKGKKIGVVSYEYNDKELISQLKTKLENMGTELVDVELDASGVFIFNNIAMTFKSDFEDYAQKYNLPVKTLDGLLEYNREEPKRRIKYGQDLLEAAARVQAPDRKPIEESIRLAKTSLAALFDQYQLDAVVFLNSSGSTEPAAAGYPELSLPFGKKGNAPQGVTFAARYGEDAKLLNMGYSFEYHVQGRLVP